MKLEEFKNYLILKFKLLETEVDKRSNDFLIIEKWNWDYEEALKFQNECVEFVLQNEECIVFIFCSHPNVFTMGRGLQKLKAENDTELIEFNSEHRNILNTNVIDIKRGGGLTFHHRGQLVFYPILKTTKYNFKVHDFMLEILETTKKSLNELLNSNHLAINKDLLGLWYEDRYKIASIGLAVNRFVTYHGLALNFFNDDSMKVELLKVYPCGLPGDLYRSVGELSDLKLEELNFHQFLNQFKKNLYDMIDKHKSSDPIIDLISNNSKLPILSDSNLNTDLS